MTLVDDLLTSDPSYTLYVTGHSLGGALANFASIWIQHFYPHVTVNHIRFGFDLSDMCENRPFMASSSTANLALETRFMPRTLMPSFPTHGA